MTAKLIEIDLASQRLYLLENGEMVFQASVATAINGAGEQCGSECTPRGWHIIRAMIGNACPVNTVYVGRRPSGEIYSPGLARRYPGRDWILTRILWLSGVEVGFNRLGPVDTMRRYIYIHGCPENIEMGIPSSHGCIRMHNKEIMALFDQVGIGMRVHIRE